MMMMVFVVILHCYHCYVNMRILEYKPQLWLLSVSSSHQSRTHSSLKMIRLKHNHSPIWNVWSISGMIPRTIVHSDVAVTSFEFSQN